MKTSKLHFDMSVWAAILTWLAVFILSLYFVYNSDNLQVSYALISLLFISYMVCFLFLTQPLSETFSQATRLSVLVLQLLTTYILVWLLPINFLAILTIIWVAVLLSFIPVKTTLLITLVVIVSWFSLYAWRWSESYVWVSAILYGSFHFFAVLMSHQTHEAMLQKQKAERLNRELLATQDLVQQASRQQERTRIARDLHDLVGHHLTALIINLEVAKHQTEGAAREQVEKSHALAKLLLSDVREAISEIRLRDAININGLIELWRSYIPSLDIKTEIDEEIEWHDLTITQTLSFCILEAITNTMRHANANEIVITIEKDGQNILATIRDDGKVSDSITPGNGLTGMCERLQAVGGELKTDIANGQLVLKIKLPAEVQHDH